MTLLQIIEVIGDFTVPIYPLEYGEINNEFCYSIVIPTDVLGKIRGNNSTSTKRDTGVYFYNCTYSKLYELMSEKTPEAVQQIIEKLNSNFQIIEYNIPLAFSIFALLHEIGHVYHLNNSGMSYEEYWRKYYKERDALWIDYQFEYYIIAKTPIEKKNVNLKYGEIYRNIEIEHLADDFAINHFEECYNRVEQYMKK